jgi:hypothetical protein
MTEKRQILESARDVNSLEKGTRHRENYDTWGKSGVYSIYDASYQ